VLSCGLDVMAAWFVRTRRALAAWFVRTRRAVAAWFVRTREFVVEPCADGVVRPDAEVRR
jgi:hypothetical protein